MCKDFYPENLKLCEFASDDCEEFESTLARILYNRVPVSVPWDITMVCCDIIDNTALKSYEITVIPEGFIELTTKCYHVRFDVYENMLSQSQVYAVIDGSPVKADLECFNNTHYVFSIAGEAIATCPVDMWLSVLSEKFGKLMLMCDVPTPDTVLTYEDYRDFDSVISTLLFSSDEDDPLYRNDMHIAVNSLLSFKRLKPAEGNVMLDGVILLADSNMEHLVS